MTALVSFRAAGWLAAPDGESRASTTALIKDLVSEIERLREALQLIADGTYTEKGAEDWANFVLTTNDPVSALDVSK